jgi:hypothetical protein
MNEVEDQISATIEDFLEQLQAIDVATLSESELTELQSVISDFKGDLTILETLEYLSSTLKDSLDAKAVNELKSEMSTEQAMALQHAKENKLSKNQSIGYGKLQRD